MQVAQRRRWPTPLPVQRQPSQADLICAAAQDVDQALEMWRVVTVSLARRVLKIIPQSRAAHELLIAARRGELPLWNGITLLNGVEQ